METIADTTFDTFKIPLDDRNQKYLLARHEHIFDFCEANRDILEPVITRWLVYSVNEADIPIAAIPGNVILDLVELGMVYGYLLKESELRST